MVLSWPVRVSYFIDQATVEDKVALKQALDRRCGGSFGGRVVAFRDQRGRWLVEADGLQIVAVSCGEALELAIRMTVESLQEIGVVPLALDEATARTPS